MPRVGVELTVANPPRRAVYRVFNHFNDIFSVSELAEPVKKQGERTGPKGDVVLPRAQWR